jgi:hypothetical protein
MTIREQGCIAIWSTTELGIHIHMVLVSSKYYWLNQSAFQFIGPVDIVVPTVTPNGSQCTMDLITLRPSLPPQRESCIYEATPSLPRRLLFIIFSSFYMEY